MKIKKLYSNILIINVSCSFSGFRHFVIPYPGKRGPTQLLAFPFARRNGFILAAIGAVEMIQFSSKHNSNTLPDHVEDYLHTVFVAGLRICHEFLSESVFPSTFGLGKIIVLSVISLKIKKIL